MRELVSVKLSLFPAASAAVADVIWPVILFRVTAEPAIVPEAVSNPDTFRPLKVIPLGASKVIVVPAVTATVDVASISTVPPLSSFIVEELTVTRSVELPS
jgi:hypothetical protein